MSRVIEEDGGLDRVEDGCEGDDVVVRSIQYLSSYIFLLYCRISLGTLTVFWYPWYLRALLNIIRYISGFSRPSDNLLQTIEVASMCCFCWR